MADTIFALASGAGKAGVSVVRVSGPGALSGCEQFCALPDARQSGLRKIRLADGQFLDEALRKLCRPHRGQSRPGKSHGGMKEIVS